jgi:hypothetical protein
MKMKSEQRLRYFTQEVIKIVYQRALGVSGTIETWGIIVRGQPRRVFHSKGELKAFLEGLYG